MSNVDQMYDQLMITLTISSWKAKKKTRKKRIVVSQIAYSLALWLIAFSVISFLMAVKCMAFIY